MGDANILKIVGIAEGTDSVGDIYRVVGKSWLRALRAGQKSIIANSPFSVQKIVKVPVIASIYGVTRHEVHLHLKSLLGEGVRSAITQRLIDVIRSCTVSSRDISWSLAKAILNPENRACVGGTWVDMSLYRRH